MKSGSHATNVQGSNKLTNVTLLLNLNHFRLIEHRLTSDGIPVVARRDKATAGSGAKSHILQYKSL